MEAQKNHSLAVKLLPAAAGFISIVLYALNYYRRAILLRADSFNDMAQRQFHLAGMTTDMLVLLGCITCFVLGKVYRRSNLGRLALIILVLAVALNCYLHIF
jgi:hypothetical protein